MAESPFREICSPTFCGSFRNFDRRLIHRPREAFRCHAFEQKTKENQRTTAALAHVLKSGPRSDNV
jgi:hypothetical protein